MNSGEDAGSARFVVLALEPSRLHTQSGHAAHVKEGSQSGHCAASLTSSPVDKALMRESAACQTNSACMHEGPSQDSYARGFYGYQAAA